MCLLKSHGHFCRIIFLFLTGLTINSCSSHMPRVNEHNLNNNVQSMSYTADIRGVHFLHRPDGSVWILSEPPPDAAFSYDDSQSSSLGIKMLNIGGSSENENEKSSAGGEDLPLTGRTSYVLLAREMLYRVNEMAYNTNATTEQYIQAQKNAFAIIETIAKLEIPNISHKTTVALTTGVQSNLSSQQENIDTNPATSTNQINMQDSTVTTQNDSSNSGW